jgi:hypothetical protein
MSGVIRRPSPAMVVGLTALFVALSGSSYAAIKANSVGAKQIKANAVQTGELQDAGVGAADLGDNSVGAAELQDGAVGSGDVGEGSITGDDVQDESLGGADVLDESLTGGDVQNGSIGTAQVQDGSIGTAEIQDGSVSGNKILNGTLTRGEFAAGELPPQMTFARVQANGTLQPNTAGLPPQNQGTILVSKGEGAAATGTYCFDLDSRPASAMVSLDNADAAANVDLITSVAIDRGEDLGDCPANRNDARVRILDTNLPAAGAAGPGPADARFFIWFIR